MHILDFSSKFQGFSKHINICTYIYSHNDSKTYSTYTTLLLLVKIAAYAPLYVCTSLLMLTQVFPDACLYQ